MNNYKKELVFLSVLVILVASIFYIYQVYFSDFEPGPGPAALSESEVLAEYFPERVDIYINDYRLEASVASTEEDIKQGLSGTPYLPDGVVKLFVFASSDNWGIWMKDMNYPIDIVWLDSKSVVVDSLEAVSPDSYPAVYKPSSSSRYIIEAQAGFVAAKDIKVGDQVYLPLGL